MSSDLPAIVGLVGGTFTLFTAMMSLRNEMDNRRNISLGLTEENRQIAKELRLYILRKDVAERWFAMITVMVATGFAFVLIASFGDAITTYLRFLLAAVGLACVVASIVIWAVGRRDLEDCREYIRSGKVSALMAGKGPSQNAAQL